MKEFITGVETGKQESGASVREQVTRPETHSDPEVIKELVEKVAQSGQERLEVLQPETPEQEKKKGFLAGIGEKIKGIIKGKELSPGDYIELGMRAINGHPMKKRVYDTFASEDLVKAEKFALAVGKNPDVKYWAYDEVKQDFVDKTRYTVASGEGTSGA
jgi:hypothetical protein